MQLSPRPWALAVGLAWALAAIHAVQAAPSWPSGMISAPRAEAGAWRGSPIDVATVYLGMTTWQHVQSSAQGLTTYINSSPRVVLAMPMVPKSAAGQLQACADGLFDAEIAKVRAAIARVMVSTGKPDFVWWVRLGWEANRVGTPTAYAWQATLPGAWVGCWRRWSQILNPPDAQKRFLLVWNVANRGNVTYPIGQMYPGDDVVDVVASQYYDRCPPIRTQADMTKNFDARDKAGNPVGPNAWVAFARAHGKRYAVPEWGIGGSPTVCAKPGIDNPFFVRSFFAWLKALGPDLAFEAYFNGRDADGYSHAIYGSSQNPKAAAAYRSLW